MRTKRRLGIVLVAAIVIVIGYWAASNRLFVNRYLSFIANGYDAHTVPVDWFEPRHPVAGGSGGALPPVDPAQRSIPAGLIAEVLDYAEQQDSMALIIVRHGRIEAEAYWGANQRDTLFNPQSMSKTVLAMLVGIAIEDGAIRSIDDPIGDYLDEWREDPRGRITIHNLLQMSGGLAQISESYTPVPWSKGVRQHFGMDFNHWILQLELVDRPGSKWDYNNNENNLLGLVLERATGTPYPVYLSEKLWRALDLAAASMYLDQPGGSVMKSCCIMSRPIDWTRLGLLILNKGRYGERQILPDGWVEQMITPSENFAGYGYQIWLGSASLGGTAQLTPPASVQSYWASEGYIRRPRFPACLGDADHRHRGSSRQSDMAQGTVGSIKDSEPFVAGAGCRLATHIRRSLRGGRAPSGPRNDNLSRRKELRPEAAPTKMAGAHLPRMPGASHCETT